MKILGCADLHARKESPVYRCDDYWLAFRRKLNFVVDTANEHDALLTISGDIFDSSRASVEVLNTVAAILKRAVHVPLAVAGQHDLLYHTNLKKTPLWNLHMNGVIKLIDQYDYPTVVSGVSFAGASFEEEIPDEEADVLLIHACVTEGEPPFFLKEAIAAYDIAEALPQFKYIISGDYHPSHHHISGDDRHVINCGTLMRNKKDMKDHEPVVWLIDTDKDTVTPVAVPHEPYSTVFNLEKIEREKKHGITIDTSKVTDIINKDSVELKLDIVVWQVRKTFKEQGVHIRREAVEKVLMEATRGKEN